MRNNKVVTYVWIGFLALMLITEAVVAFIPKSPGINVASSQIAGTPAPISTDISSLTGTTTTPLTPAENVVIQGMIPIVGVFMVVGILVMTRNLGGGDDE